MNVTLVDYKHLWPQDQYMLYELYQLGAQVSNKIYISFRQIVSVKFIRVACSIMQ